MLFSYTLLLFVLAASMVAAQEEWRWRRLDEQPFTFVLGTWQLGRRLHDEVSKSSLLLHIRVSRN